MPKLKTQVVRLRPESVAVFGTEAGENPAVLGLN